MIGIIVAAIFIIYVACQVILIDGLFVGRPMMSYRRRILDRAKHYLEMADLCIEHHPDLETEREDCIRRTKRVLNYNDYIKSLSYFNKVKFIWRYCK